MGADAALQVSRPRIRVAGTERPALAEGLVSLRVHEGVEGLFDCEATFGNWGATDAGTGYLYFDRQMLEYGRELEVLIADDTIFKGRISALEGRFPDGGGVTLTVRAEDSLQDLRMTRRTRSFADSSDSQVISQIASEHGLAADVSAPGPTHKVLAQLNQSDLAFLRSRVRAIGAELWVDGQTLRARPRSARAGSPVTLGYGNELRDLTIGADLAGQRTSFKVTGWDVAAKAGIGETATAGDLGAETGGGDSGPVVLAAAFGERPELVAHWSPSTGGEAQAGAAALFKARARSFVSGRGVAEANARLRAGATVRMRGVGPLFDGDYYVVEALQRFDGVSGLRTEFAVERPALGRPL